MLLGRLELWGNQDSLAKTHAPHLLLHPYTPQLLSPGPWTCLLGPGYWGGSFLSWRLWLSWQTPRKLELNWGSLRSSEVIPEILEPLLAQWRAPAFVKARGASRIAYNCREGDRGFALSFFLTFILLLLGQPVGSQQAV